MDVEAGVREFLRDQGGARDVAGIGADESLLDSGLLDSASILELVTFLESRFGIEIPDEELIPQNFDTINAIDTLVSTKTSAASDGEPQG